MMKGDLILGHLLKSLGSWYKKYVIGLIILVYLFETYGSLFLYYFTYISKEIWDDIHMIGSHLVLIMFIYYVKKHINILSYSICMGLFGSRLISQIIFKGFEFWYEIPGAIILSVLILYLSRRND